MKCELCHKEDAKAAINRVRGGKEEELYVCEACARKEKKAAQRRERERSQREDDDITPEVSLSITRIGGNGILPPVVEALMHALTGMETDKASKEEKTPEAKPVRHPREVTIGKVAGAYRVGNYLHLEGLSLIGEIEAAQRAARALELELVGLRMISGEDAGHAYRLMHNGNLAVARRFLADLVRQEQNARIRLESEETIIFEDTICRALAILKSCRLLTAAENFDLLSPIRLAVIGHFIKGIDITELDVMMASIDIKGSSDSGQTEGDIKSQDMLDVRRAKEMNKRFAKVTLAGPMEEILG